MADKKPSEWSSATIEAIKERGVSYLTVSSLPETIAEGVVLLYNNTLWRGLLSGESSLPAGTPWPVKGYKEFIAYAKTNLNDPLNRLFLVMLDDIGLVYAHSEEANVYSLSSGAIGYYYIVYGYADTPTIINNYSLKIGESIGVEDSSEGDYIMANMRIGIKVFPPPSV